MTEDSLTPRTSTSAEATLGTAEVLTHAQTDEFLRFSLAIRLQHIGLFVSVIALIITGLPLKFSDSVFAAHFFQLIGGVEVSALVHRIAAAVLIAVGVVHMMYITLTREGRREFIHLLPRLKDFTDVGRNLLYFFGFSKIGARFGRFSYLEKFDYWAVYWGMVIMIGSGLMLWFYEYSMSVMPKLYVDVAREAHSHEALLATLAIIIWHFYNVHFNPRRFPMSSTWLDGKISREEMLHEHPVEYEQIMAERQAHSSSGHEQTAPDADEEER